MKQKNNIDDANESTPYTRAQEEWASRIGSAKTQLINWQIIGLGSIITTIILLVALLIIMNKHQEYVYIAQVQPNENVVNTVSLNKQLSPTMAQKAYFVGEFINNIMNIPLDPVVARNNWVNAYSQVNGQAISQLTSFAQSINPLANLGNQTSSVQINNFNAISDNSLQFSWIQITYNSQGQVIKQVMYNGLFTLQQSDPPKDVQGVLTNPFGLKIVYFSMNSEGSQ